MAVGRDDRITHGASHGWVRTLQNKGKADRRCPAGTHADAQKLAATAVGSHGRKQALAANLAQHAAPRHLGRHGIAARQVCVPER